MQSLGEKIYEMRKKSGLSQEDLAYKIGVSRQTVSKWETNAMQPNLESIRALSSILNVPLDFLVKDDFESVVAADCLEIAPNCINEEIHSKKYITNKIVSTVLAVVLSICSVVMLTFSIIIGQTALSSNKGNDTVSNFKFDNWMFYLCLVVTIVFFIISVIYWIKAFRIKNNKM